MRTNRHASGKPVRGRTHTFVTQKAWCTPSRVFVEKAYSRLGIDAKYGPVVHHYERDEDGKEKVTPTSQDQSITVRESQADWAEYVLGAVASQTGIEVVSGIRSARNFENGKKRKGVPMPWMYAELDKIPDDDIKTCVANLPRSQRKAAEEAMKRGEVDTRFGAAGLRWTSTKRSNGSSQSKGGNGTKKSTKSRRAASGRSTSKGRGSHRGAHRNR